MTSSYPGDAADQAATATGRVLITCSGCGMAASPSRWDQRAGGAACPVCGADAPVDLFLVYFDVADELDGGLTLADLDQGWVAKAHQATEVIDGLPWPPELAVAEELGLDQLAHWLRRG